jgi:hypothetical protein
MDISCNSTYSRKARLEDFFNDDEEIPLPSNSEVIKTSYNKNNNKESIDKNQQEFGHRKRIKP